MRLCILPFVLRRMATPRLYICYNRFRGAVVETARWDVSLVYC